MTMRPGPMMARRVSRRADHDRRESRSCSRIVPNAPWMSPTWALSSTADGSCASISLSGAVFSAMTYLRAPRRLASGSVVGRARAAPSYWSIRARGPVVQSGRCGGPEGRRAPVGPRQGAVEPLPTYRTGLGGYPTTIGGPACFRRRTMSVLRRRATEVTSESGGEQQLEDIVDRHHAEDGVVLGVENGRHDHVEVGHLADDLPQVPVGVQVERVLLAHGTERGLSLIHISE